MAETWMAAADQHGIPTAFVISKTGEIAWIGHPMTLKERVLDQVLNGEFDARKAAAEYTLKKEQEKKSNQLWSDFQQASNAKEWDKAENYLDQLDKLSDGDFRGARDMQRLRLNLQKGDFAKAEPLARSLAQREPNNLDHHNDVAWGLISVKNLPSALVDLAEKEATRANELAKGSDAAVLDTVARVQFVKGQKDAAIATQQKAVDLADPGLKKGLQATLDSYKNGKLPE